MTKYPFALCTGFSHPKCKTLHFPQNPLLGALGVPTSSSAAGGLPSLPGAPGAPGGAGDLASMFQMAQLQFLMNPAMAAAAAAAGGGQGPPGLPGAPSPASLMQSQVRTSTNNVCLSAVSPFKIENEIL